ncbi:hypothetical protein Pmani_006380 [Petrolisthes manimaculis]|uniref:Uncharacterized protein n=1 Tax=Petrolisthes manimaculis TaxID=1843537 RepID=A0AAE1QD03_9EUCA|nr:hypothetical protein Pmani_006380 [Petrolisthes manimaculis]
MGGNDDALATVGRGRSERSHGLSVTWIVSPVCHMDCLPHGLSATWIVCHMDCLPHGLSTTWIACHLDCLPPGLPPEPRPTCSPVRCLHSTIPLLSLSAFFVPFFSQCLRRVSFLSLSAFMPLLSRWFCRSITPVFSVWSNPPSFNVSVMSSFSVTLTILFSIAQPQYFLPFNTASPSSLLALSSFHHLRRPFLPPPHHQHTCSGGPPILHTYYTEELDTPLFTQCCVVSAFG